MCKTVFVNGTFDILHPGHIQLFKVARSLGEKVIVATDTDEKISEDKGGGKPVHSAGYRVCLLYTSPSPRDLSTSRMPSSA